MPPDVGGWSPGWAETTPVWAEPFHEAWMELGECDFRIRFARAQAAEMAAATPFIREAELIIGGDRLLPIVTARETPFGNGIRYDARRAEDLKRDHPEQAERIDGIVSYWKAWYERNPNRVGITCHSSLAWERVLEFGIDGMRRYVGEWRAKNVAQRPGCAEWYDALAIVLDGVSAFVTAHADAAGAAGAAADATRDPGRRSELERIAAACRHVAHGRPRSFHEAVQLFYLLFILCGHDSPGPVDRYLYPWLKADLEAGAITLAAAQEIVDCLWIKFAGKTAYGATLAGQLRDGTDATNELSFLCVNAIHRLRLLSPRTAVRWHRGISREFLRQACETVAEGASFPAFVNDDAIIPAAVERGMALEDAREYTFVGCGQTFPHGRGHGNYEDVIIHSTKALELALRNGRDPETGSQAGPETGEPADFATYEQFEHAWRRQIESMIAGQINYINERRAAIKGQMFDFLRSLLTRSCIERGLDWHEGGADYSEGMVDLVGLTTVTDSLAAIKCGVFDREVISLPELVAILDRNWEGEEALRQFFLNKLPKFGNGSPEADGMAAAELERLNGFIKGFRTCFGGPWGVDIIGWSAAVMFGERTSATPDGRRAGEPVADCAGPAQGRNVKGLTQTLESVARLPHRHVHGPLALSLRFPKDAVNTAGGRGKLLAAIESYFIQGGQQPQISIASADDMINAQKTPDAYRSLMVRIGGFSAYFTRLEKKCQDDMIARSQMGL